MRLMMILLSLLALAGCSALDQPTPRATHLLLLGADADPDALPRDSQSFLRVHAAAADALSQRQVQVFDASAVTLEWQAPARHRWSDAELLELARSLTRPAMDVVGSYRIQVSRHNTPHNKTYRMRAIGRLLVVTSGRMLGELSVDGPAFSVAPGCTHDCLRTAFAEPARILGRDLAGVLADQLSGWQAQMAPPQPTTPSHTPGQYTQHYTLVLQGFAPEAVLRLESHLQALSGYVEHRYSYSGHRRAELWYGTRLGSAALNSALRSWLTELEMPAYVQFSGNQFTIEATLSKRAAPVPEPDGNW